MDEELTGRSPPSRVDSDPPTTARTRPDTATGEGGCAAAHEGGGRGRRAARKPTGGHVPPGNNRPPTGDQRRYRRRRLRRWAGNAVEDQPGRQVNRPGFDRYFLTVAEAIARRSGCTRSRAGAVLVRLDRSIASTGYNGTDSGKNECLQGGCLRGREPNTCIAYHAEENALRFVRAGDQPVTCYVTREPCQECRHKLECIGVRRVVWPEGDLKL